MALASRNFNAKQALEKEIKDLYAEIDGGVPEESATATLNLATDITLQSAAGGTARNTTTFELVVEAAAANPTDTVLVSFTGTAAAIICTVTPNDGTNNGATPVDLDEDELAELINTGAVVGKTITLTDASNLRTLQSANGGASSALSSSDDQTVSFAGGVDNVPASFISSVGFASIVRNVDGDYTLTLQDAYDSIKYIKAIVKSSTAQDLICQLQSQTVSNSASPQIRILMNNGTSQQQVNNGTILLKIELKNSSV